MPNSPDSTRVMDGLRRLVRALRVSSHEVERTLGVSGAQMFVLRELAAAPEQSLGELAARTLTTAGTVSEVVKRLVERGLVQRRAAPDDARRAALSLTPQGRTLLARAPEPIQARLARALARLPADRRRALADAMDLWVVLAGLGGTEAELFFETGEERRAAG